MKKKTAIEQWREVPREHRDDAINSLEIMGRDRDEVADLSVLDRCATFRALANAHRLAASVLREVARKPRKGSK